MIKKCTFYYLSWFEQVHVVCVLLYSTVQEPEFTPASLVSFAWLHWKADYSSRLFVTYKYAYFVRAALGTFLSAL